MPFPARLSRQTLHPTHASDRGRLPQLKITAFCWQQVTEELDRVAPLEGILVPLVALEPARDDFNPCTLMQLEDIAEVILGGVVLVPHHRQRNQLARVSVREHTDDLVGEKVEELVRRFPRLRACAYLHSHPFSIGRTWPSRGPTCDYEGHMLPLLHSNREAGLNTSFSFIACRGLRGSRWRLQGFALDRDARIVDLGFFQKIPDGAAELASVTLPPLARRPMMRALVRRWRRDLRRRGYHCRVDELFDGWTRAIVEVTEQYVLVILLPIEFPQKPPRLFAVDKQSGQTRPFSMDAGSLTSPRAWSRAVERVEEICDDQPR